MRALRSVVVGVFLAAGGVAEASSVLIVHATSSAAYASDAQAKLEGTGRLSGPIDIFDAAAGTPTLGTLEGYDAVMFWGFLEDFDDPTALGDALADYVDGGGGVVATYGDGPSGRWASDGYDAIIRSGTSIIDKEIGTIYIPGHPIMEDVSFIHNETNWPGDHLHDDAVLVADWYDIVYETYHDHMVATLEIFTGRVASVNMPAWSADANPNNGWTGDGAILLANALNYVAPAAIPSPAALMLGLAGVALAGAGSRFRRRRRGFAPARSRAHMESLAE